jgi:DNA-directed RNA polymerase
MSAILLAKSLLGNPIYFSWFLDFRGRVYPTAYPLSPQGDSFSKKLLKLNIPERTVSVDATCSGLSIIGGILGDVNLLKNTNVFSSSETKADLYMLVLGVMIRL